MTENNINLYQDLHKETKADLLSWYMIVFGLICLALAGLFIYLGNINYKDFYINGHAMGNYLLMAAMALYFGGRIIKFVSKKKKSKTQ